MFVIDQSAPFQNCVNSSFKKQKPHSRCNHFTALPAFNSPFELGLHPLNLSRSVKPAKSKPATNHPLSPIEFQSFILCELL